MFPVLLLHRIIELYGSRAGYTYMDNVLTPFWNWVVSFIPLYVAPNTLTFLGLLTMIFGNVLLAIYVPTLSETAPSWVQLE